MNELLDLKKSSFSRIMFTVTLTIVINSILINYPGFFNDVFGQMHGGGGDGHNLPPSIIGDRELFLKFNNPGNNIPHVTYIISIYDDKNKNLMTETLHGHNGDINIEFINNNIERYHVSANYDTLAASYVADFGSPIKIEGPIFSSAGEYRLVAEITGIDFDNTFLPQPLKYEYKIEVK
jgi:hypothetical protein